MLHFGVETAARKVVRKARFGPTEVARLSTGLRPLPHYLPQKRGVGVGVDADRNLTHRVKFESARTGWRLWVGGVQDTNEIWLWRLVNGREQLLILKWLKRVVIIVMWLRFSIKFFQGIIPIPPSLNITLFSHI